MVSGDVKILLVGDPQALEGLRGELPTQGIELRPLDDFLVEYDRNTLSGEERLRNMEALYASMRGMLVVRLMLVNLNPEAIRTSGDRLHELYAAWKRIEERLEELLQERQDERIEFVTILVTEEGDWTEERGEILKGFSQNREGSKFRMRCYLMTRLLELGKDRVVHARNAWPSFVAGLIRHFLWRSSHAGGDWDADRRRFFEQDGLFAWRTLQVVAGVSDSLVKEKVRAILKRISEKFFGKRLGALYPDALSVNSDSYGALRFESEISNPFRNASWSELGMEPENSIGAIDNEAKWKRITEDHAAMDRKSWWGMRSAEQNLALVASGSRVSEAKNHPGCLFPGSLPAPALQGLPEVADVLRGISKKVESVESRSAQLRDWWEDHLKAARGFVVSYERWIVGLVVSSALAYGILVVLFSIQKYLPVSLFPVASLLMLAGAAVAGVFVMLLLGYLTQQWRGRAAQRVLAEKGDECILAGEALRQEVADSMRISRRVGAHSKEAATRRQLVDRLGRIEQVLISELQPGAIEEYRNSVTVMGEEDDAQHLRALLDVTVPSSPRGDFSEDKLVDHLTRDFFRDWQLLLERAGNKVMIPAAKVLQLCRRTVSDLKEKVNAELRESAAENLMGSNGAQAIKEILIAAELNGNNRDFYSVDLHGGVPRDSIWHRVGLKDAFPPDGFERVEAIDSNKITKGSLAVLYGECPLRFETATGQGGRLLFQTAYREGAGS